MAAKYLVVLHMGGRHVEDEVTPSIGTGRHHPVGVGRHDQVNAVPHRVGVDPLWLHQDRLLGDQPLEHRLVGPVAGKERLVGEQNRAVLQMGIEMADQVLGVHDVLEMGAEQPPELLREHALADAFLAAENDRDLALPFGMLCGICHPAEQILRICPIAAADVLVQMREVQAAVAGLWSRSRSPSTGSACRASSTLGAYTMASYCRRSSWSIHHLPMPIRFRLAVRRSTSFFRLAWKAQKSGIVENTGTLEPGYAGLSSRLTTRVLPPILTTAYLAFISARSESYGCRPRCPITS